MNFNSIRRIALALPFLSFATGCSAGPLCKSLGDCGGDIKNIIGQWTSDDANQPGCLDTPYFQGTTLTSPGAPSDNTLYGRPSPTARQTPPEATNSAWCAGLGVTADPMDPLQGGITFLFEDPNVTQFGELYNADGTYQAGFTYSGRFGQWYSQTCITQFGFNPYNCPYAQNMLTMVDTSGTYADAACSPQNGVCDCAYGGGAQHLAGDALMCKIVELVVTNKGGVNENFSNFVCEPDPSGRGGCLCGFDAHFATGEKGYYTYDGVNLITHYPQGNALRYASKQVVCQQGDTLQITGFDGSYLLNRPPVRTFTLHKAAAATP
ncbi:MAG TPA: hypothetical protein VHJ20_12730 [Polyangia bacterium]|nr:hypothetical protein [Polyangia bacterium]